jgi:hypothetical protein
MRSKYAQEELESFIKKSKKKEVLGIFDELVTIIERDVEKMKSGGLKVSDLENQLPKFKKVRETLVQALDMKDTKKCHSLVSGVLAFMDIVEKRKEEGLKAVVKEREVLENVLKGFDMKLDEIKNRIGELEFMGLNVSDLELALVELSSKRNELEQGYSENKRQQLMNYAERFMDVIETRKSRFEGEKLRATAEAEKQKEATEEQRIKAVAKERTVREEATFEKPKIEELNVSIKKKVDKVKGGGLLKPVPVEGAVIKKLHRSMDKHKEEGFGDKQRSEIEKIFDESINNIGDKIKEVDDKGVDTFEMRKAFYELKAKKRELKEALEKGDSEKVRSLIHTLKEFALIVEWNVQ